MLLFEVATQLIDLAARGFKSLWVSDKATGTCVHAFIVEYITHKSALAGGAQQTVVTP